MLSIGILPAAGTKTAPVNRAMRRSVGQVAALLLFALVATACKDSSSPKPDPQVTGSWTGTSSGYTMNLTLTEGTDGAVGGSGNLQTSGGNIALTVRQGTFAYPNLSLILGATGYQDMNFAGKMSDEDDIPGTLNGSGFDNFNLNRTRN